MKKFSYPQITKKFPPEVKKLFAVFGDDIRLVGGSVRDLLLKKNLHDFDFCTPFLPDEITATLEKNKIKAVPTGAKFGTITAVLNKKNFEITTLRKDNETDGRHCIPQFVDDYRLDASRRDFTMNALYADLHGGVTDFFGGIPDLQDRKLRFIGDAKKRIEEDHLRILRFFRFSCEYAQKLDAEGLKACVELKGNIEKLSRERIRGEFLKMLSSKKTANLLAVLKVMKSKKILDAIFSAKADVARLERLFENEKEPSLNLRLAALFLGKKIDLEKFFAEIVATNVEKRYFRFFASQKPQTLDLKGLKQLLAFEEKELVFDFYLFSQKKISKKNLAFIKKFSNPEFPLSGEDVMKLGYKGIEIGKALQKARKFWAQKDFKLKKNQLENFLKRA